MRQVSGPSDSNGISVRQNRALWPIMRTSHILGRNRRQFEGDRAREHYRRNGQRFQGLAAPRAGTRHRQCEAGGSHGKKDRYSKT